MKSIYQAFGEGVRKRRKELGISQEDLAFQINRDVRSVIAIETGDRNPTLKTIYSLCKALKINSSKLLSF